MPTHYGFCSFASTWPFYCSLFLPWIQINFLNMKNGLYKYSFDFSFTKPIILMFAFDLLLKLCFWADCFIFSFDELNALTFCLPCRWWSCRGLARWPGLPLKLLHMEKMKLHQIYTWKYEKLCFSSKDGFEEKSITSMWLFNFLLLRLYLTSSCTCWPLLSFYKSLLTKP